MALLSHLGPQGPLPPVGRTQRFAVHGTIRPLLTQMQRGQKGPRGQFICHQSQLGPKLQVGTPEPVLAPNTNQSRNGQKTLRAKMDQGTQVGHCSVHGLWQPPEANSLAPIKDSHQAQGKPLPSSMHPLLKDPGVVHI
ncbi:hypothetical protein O181_124393 [Austropuccinia psidii MF-1]|uniref:Uncharacterized protein n=1 Tax=Austropuccinia psidii MF-1 TaxID=1389203 RepID=A0A9Q3KNM0_9BASI|nr:hypothetical protein [Austropuccinia psidii MF-1]